MKCLSCRCQVPSDHPVFPGHFPANPIVPGVVLLALVNERATELGFAGTGSWRRVKFLKPVGPDEPIHIQLEGDRHRFRFRIETPVGTLIAHGHCSHVPLA